MPVPELGKLEPVRPRKIWQHEERDFTPWLANNLHLLNEALDLDLELIDTESYLPGSGRVDILAKDQDRDAVVVIENQLESSDDDHFARLIGYAASRNARILIWVAGGFYEWHRRMLDWLNAADDIDAYGVEVSAWRIGAAMAPELRCVARPSARPHHQADAPVSAAARLARFYGPVVEQLRRAGMPPQGRGGFRGRWRSFATGHDRLFYVLQISDGDGNAWAFFNAHGDQHRQVYRALLRHQAQIDAAIGDAAVEWHEGENQSWIGVKTPASLDDSAANLAAAQAWMVNNLLQIRDAVQPYLDQVMPDLPSEAAARNALSIDWFSPLDQAMPDLPSEAVPADAVPAAGDTEASL